MNAEVEAERFLRDLDRVYPGASAVPRRGGTASRSRTSSTGPPTRSRWAATPATRPGYFTTIARQRGQALGNLYFAGEHANSFYVWQGFMEGAALSGLDTAAQLLTDLKARLRL